MSGVGRICLGARSCVPGFRQRALVLAALMLGGCASFFPHDVKQQVSEEGTAMVSGWSWAGMSYLVSAQYIPGDLTPLTGMRQKTGCMNDRYQVEVRWRDPSVRAPAAGSLCEQILAGVTYISNFSERQGAHRIIVDTVAPDTRWDWRWRSFSPPGGLTVRLAVRWLDDEEHRAAEAVRLFAHEVAHLDAFFSAPESTVDTEPLAYLAGACAQWHVLGTLSTRDLQAGEMNVRDAVFQRSGDAARVVWARLHPFVEHGPLRRDAALAPALTTHCSAWLRAGF